MASARLAAETAAVKDEGRAPARRAARQSCQERIEAMGGLVAE